MHGGHGHKHSWMMLIGCLVPLLMIFVLPLLGVREGWIVPLALGAMLLCHLVSAAAVARKSKSDKHIDDAQGDHDAHH